MRKVTETLNSKLVTVSITELLVQCFPITIITTTKKIQDQMASLEKFY